MAPVTDAPTRSRTTRWAWIAALWCAGALIDSSQTILIMHAEGRPKPWLPLFAVEFASWLPWVLATPFIVGLARRFPLARGDLLKAAAVHLPALVIVSVVDEAWSAWLQVLFDPWVHAHPIRFVRTFNESIAYQILAFVIAYALILTVTYGVDSRDAMARQATETARLNEELSRAQLAALRRQMDPHFMFNTLNAIAGLVRDKRNDTAVGMIVGLSEFLRRATQDSHRATVALAEEVEYLERYLDIQKARFEDRLRVRLDIAGDVRDAQVPNLMLQPLVENAIKHGVARRAAGGEVRVTAARHDGLLVLSVYNDGPLGDAGVDAVEADDANGGTGLANLRTRLHILYGDASGLDLRPAGEGVEVVVTLPLREA
jgi:signal transduction histidine kinase